jgi:probable HAF family extracellular repeat protein
MQRQLVVALAAVMLTACSGVGGLVSPAADVTATQLEYTWVPLDLRGDGFRSSARALNNQNQVVGAASTTADAATPSHAFLWENGVMQDLGTLGGTNSEATEINERGQVVGWSDAPDGSRHAFFWDDGTMQDLGPVNPTASGIYLGYPILWSPVYINDRGQVVASRPDGGAFLWENGVTQALPLDRATAIDNRGRVAGWVMSPDTAGILRRRAVLWEAGVVTELGTLGGDQSWAVAMSRSGWVAGTSVTEPRPFYNILAAYRLPFRWKDGQMDDLGRIGNETDWWAQFVSDGGQVAARHPYTCGTWVWSRGAWQAVRVPTGHACTWAFAMNGQGAITGAQGSFAGGPAFVWQDGVAYDLPGPGVASRGHDINDEGVVAGQAARSGAFAQAAMWLPVPNVAAGVP